jgi:hypothetical protein
MAEGLWLPFRLMKNKAQEPRTGPEFIVPITFSEITGNAPTAADLWKLINIKERAKTAVTLATVINAIERFSRDATLQQALSEAFVRPEYRKTPEPEPGERLPDYRYIFNPLGLLFALKLLLGAAPSSQPAPEADPYWIGDLVLIANEFVLRSSLSAGNITDSILAADFLPSWDLTNRGRIVYALARVHRMIAVHLVGSDSKVTKLVRQIGLDTKNIRCFGVSLKDFVFAVFALYARDQ